MSENLEIPEDAPAPRLCHIRKRPDYSGYGFKLHSSDSKVGKFIVKVEVGSPAESAGLREGDQVIEVNGVNVLEETHSQVVARVTEQKVETIFLVVDEEADEFYKQRNIKVDGSMPNIVRIETSLQGTDIAATHKRARLCHIKTWPDYSGYGFNLHVNKDTLVHFIGKVDEGSPAQLGGLEEGDFVIEVNGNNVQNSSHADVVRIIKGVPNEVVLLVVDEEAGDFFKNNHLDVNSDSEHVEKIFCPDVNPATVNTSEETCHPHRLRLCNIKSWKDGKGFGFNMQSERNKPGQYIVKVDLSSPAQLAGLKEGDFLVEVNGVRIEGLEHKQVVDLIKSNLQETKLLVADADAKKYFETNKIKMTSCLGCVDTITCPDSSPSDTGSNQDGLQIDSEQVDCNNKENLNSMVTKLVKEELILNVKNIPVPPTHYANQSSPISPPFSPTIVGGIEFAPTAEEARRRMARKKQANQEMSLKAKYELFQQM